MPFNGYYPYAFGFGHAIDYANKCLNWAKLQDLKHDLAQVPENRTAILYHPQEYTPPDLIQALSQCLIDSTKAKTVWLMHTGDGLVDLPGQHVRYINFDWISMHLETAVYRSATWQDHWQANATKYLFMVGKPHVGQRLRLVFQLWKQGLLNDAKYSLHISHTLRDICRQRLAEVDTPTFDQFVDQCVRVIDDKSFCDHSETKSLWHNTKAYLYPSDLYADTVFQVIMETVNAGAIGITEKTWLCIANRTPFIVLANTGTLGRLRCMGFRVFNDYLAVPDYDDIASDQHRIMAVTDNVRFWRSHIKTYRDQIISDVEHNYELLSTLVSGDWKRWCDLITEIDYPGIDATRLVPVSPQRAQWVDWYCTIRAPDWPDCVCEEHLARLPLSIQQEIHTKFGLPIF